MDTPQRREPPTPLRVPKAWKPEIAAAAKKRGITAHAFLLKAIRRVLDGEQPPQQEGK